MTVEPGYPVTLVHPSHKPATIAIGNDLSVPEKFPAVTVNGLDSENKYRALGYLRYGEHLHIEDYHEYPKILRHPDHKDEVPARVEAKIEDKRIVGTFTIPAVPAVMPDVTVNNREEENHWRELDYVPAGEYNKEVLDSILNGTIGEEEYIAAKYPMWVDGKVVEKDPNELEPILPSSEFPKFEGGIIVPDPRFPAPPDPFKYPMWVHKDGIPSDESILVNNEKEELVAKQKLMPVVEEPDEVEESEQASTPIITPAKLKSSRNASVSI